MEPDERKKFGAYLRQLREKNGMSLRDVEAAVQGVRLSNSYLYQIERGDKNPPKLEIIRELARVYTVPLPIMTAAAGYEEGTKIDLYKNQVDRAFEFIRSDPNFRYGTQAHGETLSLEAKRFIVELYEQARPGIKLLTEIADLPAHSDDEEEVEEDE